MHLLNLETSQKQPYGFRDNVLEHLQFIKKAGQEVKWKHGKREEIIFTK